MAKAGLIYFQNGIRERNGRRVAASWLATAPRMEHLPDILAMTSSMLGALEDTEA